MKQYIKVLKQYADFSGRTGRKEYWIFVLFNIIFLATAIILNNVLGLTVKGNGFGIFCFVYALAILIPGLAVTVRRLHDIGKSGWWIFISLVPMIGGLWLLALLAMAGVWSEPDDTDETYEEPVPPEYNNSPLYISPLTLLDWESDEPPSASDVRRAQKRRLAELEASGQIGISIHGKEYMKDDIIKLFDRMLADKHFPYHLQVGRNPALLKFLETGEYLYTLQFKSCEIAEDETFRRWLEPYFAAAFASFLKKSIYMKKAKDLAYLLQEKIKIADKYEEEAWEPLRKELRKAVAFLVLYNDAKFLLEDKHREHIRRLGAVSFIQILSLKPEHLFYDETYEYTRQLNNIAARIISAIPLTCYCIYNNLLNLKLESSLEKTCGRNKVGFSGYAASVHFFRSDGISGRWATPKRTKRKTETNIRAQDPIPWWGYLAIGGMILIGVRNCGTENHSRRPERKNNYIMPVQSDEQKKIIDSVATKIMTGEISADSGKRLLLIMERNRVRNRLQKRQTDSNE